MKELIHPTSNADRMAALLAANRRLLNENAALKAMSEELQEELRIANERIAKRERDLALSRVLVGGRA